MSRKIIQLFFDKNLTNFIKRIIIIYIPIRGMVEVLKMSDNKECKENVLRRLRKIEGQVKGIQKMVENGKECSDLLVQVAAVRAAINKVGGLILENHSKECIVKALNEDNSENAINDLVDTMVRFIK